MPFGEVVGQPAAERALRAALRSGRVAGAYLFHGPEGVGKLRTARVFARALLCERRGDDACEACSACRRALHGNHPDLHVLGEGEDVTVVTIPEMRDTIARLGLKPLEGGRQVVLLDHADRLNAPAGNAALKTLEEPPPDTVLVLVAAEPLRVLETIRSRCQPVRFRPLGVEQVRAVLEQEGLETAEAEALARLSSGSPGRALLLRRLGFPDLAGRAARRFLEVGRDDPVTLAGDLTPRVEGISDATERRRAERRAALETLVLLAGLARDAMVASAGARDATSCVPEDVLAEALSRFGRDPERWGKVLRRLLEAAHNVRANVGIETVLVDLLLDIERTWKSPPTRRMECPEIR